MILGEGKDVQDENNEKMPPYNAQQGQLVGTELDQT